jgi:small subunit ribosomal protein S16
MAVKIRLARRGRKKLAMFDVVVADARAPRDGKFVEKIGTYNPNTNPATIVLNEKQAIQWVLNGAQPTDTARAVLSSKGILYAKHLQVGVLKGALTQEQADAKFEAWKVEKAKQVEASNAKLAQSKAKSKASRLEAEAKVSSARAEVIAAKNKVADEAIVASVVEAINAADEEATGVEVDEVVAEAPAVEETPAVEDAPAAEEAAPAAEEAPAAEASEEAAAE